MTYQREIVEVLKRLHGRNGIIVEIATSLGSATITHGNARSLDFKFIWASNHFIGYFMDWKEIKSQAVLSLWSPDDAEQFAESYLSLIRLRAGRRGTYYWFGSRLVK